MSDNHAVWPDIVLASVLMIAGLLMLRYGVWHLVHHHEVVSPLLAGSGALALGALSIRQVLRSSSRQRRRYKRSAPSARTRWWFWAIVVSTSANGFASAPATGNPSSHPPTTDVWISNGVDYSKEFRDLPRVANEEVGEHTTIQRETVSANRQLDRSKGGL